MLFNLDVKKGASSFAGNIYGRPPSTNIFKFLHRIGGNPANNATGAPATAGAPVDLSR